MLLTIDVGNTETKLGCFSKDAQTPRPTWRITTELRRTSDEYGIFIGQLFESAGVSVDDVEAISIASVVPKLDLVLAAACERVFDVRPQFLRPSEQTAIPVLTEYPAESGADLVALAIGARARYPLPAIVVSYGTATAFVAVSAAGEYLGVAIAPGITVSLDALIGRTAKLPQVSLETPSHAIGRNTRESLQSGVVFGFVGQTEAVVARIRNELGGKATVVATGGLAEIVARLTTIVDAVDPHLSLFGLRHFHAGEPA